MHTPIKPKETSSKNCAIFDPGRCPNLACDHPLSFRCLIAFKGTLITMVWLWSELFLQHEL